MWRGVLIDRLQGEKGPLREGVGSCSAGPAKPKARGEYPAEGSDSSRAKSPLAGAKPGRWSWAPGSLTRVPPAGDATPSTFQCTPWPLCIRPQPEWRPQFSPRPGPGLAAPLGPCGWTRAAAPSALSRPLSGTLPRALARLRAGTGARSQRP